MLVVNIELAILLAILKEKSTGVYKTDNLDETPMISG
jgi:hypothetical protein